MNINTLKKYWKELEHYKNGGSLYARIWFSDPNDGDTCYTIWYKVGEEGWTIDKVFNYDLEFDKIQIIINDEHVEFRKALAEGKIVEFKHPQVGYDEWEIVTHEHLFQSVVPGREYRIKPDEHKFKVEDWVIFEDNTKHKITEINKFSYTFDNNFSCGFETHTVLSMKHWKPKQNEFCWFWDKLDLKPFLSKFIENTKDGSFVSEGITFTSGRVISIYCEPFIGELPTNLKEK